MRVVPWPPLQDAVIKSVCASPGLQCNLFRLTCQAACQADLSRLNRSGCTVPAALSWLTCPDSPVPGDLSHLSFPDWLSWLTYQAVLFRLNGPTWLFKTNLSGWQAWSDLPDWPVSAGLSRLSYPRWPFQADLSRLTCLGWPVLAELSRLNNRGWPVRQICTGWPVHSV